MKSAFLLVLGLALLGCDSAPVAHLPPLARAIPLGLKMTGAAEGSDASGRTASCLLELIFELSDEADRTPESVIYTGKMGGAIQRTVLDSEGSGISLWPHLHAEAITRLFAPDSVAFFTPVMAGVDSRFYDEISYLAGVIDEQGYGSGTWTCAPFDITEGGWVDTTLVAPGTWQSEPLPGAL